MSLISALFFDFLLSGSEKSFSLSFKSKFPKLRFFRRIVLFFELGGRLDSLSLLAIWLSSGLVLPLPL